MAYLPLISGKLALLGGLLAALGACGKTEGHPAAVAPSPSPSSAATVATGWEQGKWGVFHSQRFDLRLPLPDGKSWRIDDHKGSWLVATHAGTSSSVRLRMFLESHAQNRVKCEARVREADGGLPSVRADRTVEDVESGGPKGWDTHSQTFVEPDQKDDRKLTGHVLVFTSNVRKCLAFHFVTESAGPEAKVVVAARLAEAKERIVRDLSFDQDLGAPGREPLTAPSRLSRRNSRHCQDPAANSTQVVPRIS